MYQMPANGSPEQMRAAARARTREHVRDFPGPIAVACVPPPGSRCGIGGQNENGRPFALHVHYRSPEGGPRLLVRTKPVPVPPDPLFPPPFVTIDTLRDAVGTYYSSAPLGAWPRDEHPAETAVQILIDEVPTAGFRIDLASCSAVELDWNGQTVQCVSDAATIDGLSLRTGRDEDFELYLDQSIGR